MFKRRPDDARHSVTLTVDGRRIEARAGDSIAAALLAAGIAICRATPISGVARGPYCLMGVCFDCLVVVDGVPNRQACMLRARDGMRIERQDGARSVAP